MMIQNKPQPQFGAINVIHAKENSDGTSEMIIQLTRLDKKLNPYPQMGDQFKLSLANGKISAFYNDNDKTALDVTVGQAKPLIKKMSQGANYEQWKGLVNLKGEAMALLRDTFKKVNLHNSHGDSFLKDYAETMWKFAQFLNLAPKAPNTEVQGPNA